MFRFWFPCVEHTLAYIIFDYEWVYIERLVSPSGLMPDMYVGDTINQPSYPSGIYVMWMKYPRDIYGWWQDIGFPEHFAVGGKSLRFWEEIHHLDDISVFFLHKFLQNLNLKKNPFFRQWAYIGLCNIWLWVRVSSPSFIVTMPDIYVCRWHNKPAKLPFRDLSNIAIWNIREIYGWWQDIGKNVKFGNLIPGKCCSWREIFAILRRNLSFRSLFLGSEHILAYVIFDYEWESCLLVSLWRCQTFMYVSDTINQPSCPSGIYVIRDIYGWWQNREMVVRGTCLFELMDWGLRKMRNFGISFQGTFAFWRVNSFCLGVNLKSYNGEKFGWYSREMLIFFQAWVLLFVNV